MRKRKLAWISCITIILSTAAYFFYSYKINLGNHNKEFHILSKTDIKKDDESAHIDLVENSQIQTKRSAHIGGIYSDNTESCINISEIEHQINSEMYQQFLSDNTLTLWTVDDYLVELSNSDLELEFKAGNADAAFVIGMNLIYSSYNTSTIHPDLSRKVQQEELNERKELDSELLSAGRNWLWLAALNGIGTALTELGGSYRLESQLIEQQFKLNNRPDHENLASLKAKLIAQEISFEMLYIDTNPSIVELHQIDSGYINERFVNHEYDGKEKILKELKDKWKLKREEIGRSYTINIKISEDIQKAMDIEQIRCN